MATALLRPNLTIVNGWVIFDGGSTEAHHVLDDDVTQPDAPNQATDFVQSQGIGQVFEVGLGTISVASVSEAKLWVRGQGGTLVEGAFKLFTGATELATVAIIADGLHKWYTATYAGGLTQAQVDDLRIKGIQTSAVGNTNAFAAYAELTYTAEGGGGGGGGGRMSLLGVG